MSQLSWEAKCLREICHNVVIELIDISSFVDRTEIEKYVYSGFYFNNLLDSYSTYVGFTE